MANNKKIQGSTEQTMQQDGNNQTHLIKHKRKNARIVAIENYFEPTNVQAQQQIEALFSVFSSKFERISLPLLPEVSNQIKNDFLLSTLFRQFSQKRQEYEHLIHFIRRRWESCHRYPDYYDHLAKLIKNAIDRLTSLKEKIHILYYDMMKRVQLIAIQPIEAQDLLAAKESLICALDVFILSISVLSLNPKINPRATYCKQKISACIEDLHQQLAQQDLKINTNITNELIHSLLMHFGIHETTFGFHLNTSPKPINYNQLNQLLTNLFQPDNKKTSPQKILDQYLALHNLAARLKFYPVYSIMEYEHLCFGYHSQKEQINRTIETLIQNLNLLRTKLSQLNSLFVGVSDSNRLKNSNELIQQIDHEIDQVRKKCTTDPSKTGQTQWRISQLEQLTQLQEDLIQTLSMNTQQTSSLESKTQACVLQLEKLYSQERQYLIDGLSTTIRQAKQIANLQKNVEQLDAIKQAQNVFEELTQDQSQQPLSSIKKQIIPQYNQLMKLINEFKAELKVEWANPIFELLAKEYCGQPCNRYTSLTSILLHMRTHNEPYHCIQLSQHNPFNPVLNDLTKDTNYLLNQLINYYAKLETQHGNQLEAWINEMNTLYQKAQLIVLKQKNDTTQAQIIEMRLQNQVYRTCLQIINIMSKEFIDILQGLRRNRVVSEPNSTLLKGIFNDPYSLLKSNELPLEIKALFEKQAPFLVKLFMLIKEFQSLNSNYINLNINLCLENDYHRQLVATTIKHLTDEGRELHSRGLANANDYVELIHSYVYKPLMVFYVPEQRYDSLPSSKQTPHDALRQLTFFSTLPQTSRQIISNSDLFYPTV